MPLNVSVVTPEASLWEGEADFVVARVVDGDVGILPGHAPLLGTLHHARLIVQHGGEQTYIAVDGGFIEVLDDNVSVLTQTGERAADIDIDVARQRKLAAEQALQREDSPENRAEMLRWSNRLETAAEAGLLGIG